MKRNAERAMKKGDSKPIKELNKRFKDFSNNRSSTSVCGILSEDFPGLKRNINLDEYN
jgi:hypothetical protein